jgi:PilZ domain
MIERRATPRHNVNRAGTVAFGGGEVSCTIRSISPIGAALEVSSGLSIPHEITLLMADGRLSQHCYVVWRKPTRVGVMFDRLNEPGIERAPPEE